MNRSLIYGMIAVALCASNALAVDFTVEIDSDGPTTVAPGAKVYFAVTGQVDATGNYGLAAFVVDIQTNTGVPQGVGEQQVFGSSSVTAFARDEGLTNPDDMGGTSHEDDLIQAGGAQNTIEHTGSVPMGDVETGVAQGTETTLLEGWIVAPETPGMYTIAVANPYAAVLTSDSSPYTVEWANSSVGASDDFIFTVPEDAVYNQTQETYYSTIQGAIDDANNADVIIVYPDVYSENVDFGLAGA